MILPRALCCGLEGLNASMRCSLKVFLRLESATHICNPHTELSIPPSSLSSACWPQPVPALGMLSVAGRRGWVDTRLCFPPTSPHWMLFSFLLGGSVGARSESRAEGCGGSPGWGGMNPPALLGSTMLFGAAFGMRFFFPYNMLETGPDLSVLISLVKFHTAATCCWLRRVHLHFGIPPL